jgi:asparagine synthase (glutamine-hydrolysing)
MCGFFAILRKGSSASPGGVPFDVEHIKRDLAHRGPDDEQDVHLGPVSFAFRRLKIIDLSHGRQPMFNEDGTVCLVFNGEIYNYQDLRTELIAKGHRFEGNSDSEVIVHLYEEEGEHCVERLRGMFAFCIYDAGAGRLFGARDRFGIKPMYYIETPACVAFASEAKALLDVPGYEPRVNRAVLPDYLTFQYVPEPDTMFAGLFKVPAAHCFTYREGRLTFRRYWRVQFAPEQRSLEEFLEGTRAIMRESVRLHRQSDVPLGAFLSGGIDSTIIVALLRELGPLNTFSVGYADKAYSELDLAAESARFLETDHEEYLIEPREFWDNLPRLVWHFDDPVADPSAISLYFVARMARRKITVTLSGEGADEVFGGYHIYREPNALRPLTWLPKPILRGVGGLSGLLPSAVPGKNYLRRAATPLRERYFGNARLFTEAEKRRVLKHKEFAPSTAITAPMFDECAAAGYDDITTMQYVDLHSWMPGDILSKADKMTMANSLELRVPYLDHHVFEFAATIPTEFRVRGPLTKYVLRRAFADMVPPGAVERPKLGFPVPTRVWLRGPLREPVTEVLSDPALSEYFERSEIRELLSAHMEGRADTSRKLWSLVIFALWRDQFFGGGRRTA